MFVLVTGLSIQSTSRSSLTVLDFEDLTYNQSLSGTNYAGLFWEFGNEGYAGQQGLWKCPPPSSESPSPSYPYSGTHNLTNTWGCTLIGIQFPEVVNVLGAYFADQGDPRYITSVRVHGYLHGIETQVTDWFEDIDSHPDWFAMDLLNVDRIVVESVPVNNGGGWYGMDDFTYELPEPASLLFLLAGGSMLWYRR